MVTIPDRRVTDVVVLLAAPLTDNAVDLFGKVCTDLQTGITITDNAISGESYYVTDYTGFSSKVEEQSGNYIALKFWVEGAAPTSIKVKITKTSTLDEDGICVFRIIDKANSLTVTAKFEDRDDIVRVFTFDDLQCDTQA